MMQITNHQQKGTLRNSRPGGVTQVAWVQPQYQQKRKKLQMQEILKPTEATMGRWPGSSEEVR
jgi:hypothetical protein